MMIIPDGVSVTVHEIVSMAESGEWNKTDIILEPANYQSCDSTEDGAD